ncbi:MAG TPA: hypothetical protein VFV34_29115 [Blastocatellia bacterium]|nr:hypothetical protein [Blastocatellia bacterium]
MASQAVRDYDELLERQPDLADQSRGELTERMRNARFVFGGRQLSPYLRPHFVTRDEWRHITAACESVWSAIEKVGRQAPSNPVILEQLRLNEAEQRLVAMDPGYPDVSVTSRLDSFLTGDEYKFVELNAECPAGIAYLDVAAEIFMDLAIMREFMKSHRVSPLQCRLNLLDSLLTVYFRVRRTTDPPNIGIVDYSGLPTAREFELFKEYFEQRGLRATIADPRELELREGKLYHKDFRIDLVYRRVLVTELIDRIDECGAFVEAYRTGAAVFVNSFRTKYVHKKMLFGVLTDERHQQLFTSKEQEAIRRHIPWTRRLEQTRTRYRDEAIDLIPFVRTNGEQLVLKPNDEYGGHGIHIGWECDQSEWDRAIEESLLSDYLVQERVKTSREIFPYVNDAGGGIELREQLVDLDPLLFFGRVAAAFTRLSVSSLANVTSGAGMVPTMIVD